MIRISTVVRVEVVCQRGVRRRVGCFALCGVESQCLACCAGDEGVEFGVGENRSGNDEGCFHDDLRLVALGIVDFTDP